MERDQLRKLSLPEMLVKLDEMYAREEVVIKTANSLRREYNQLQEDKEFLQTMIMYMSNRAYRRKK